MKIGFFGVDGREKEFLKDKLKGHAVYLSEENIVEDNLPDKNDFDIISIFIGSEINEKTIEHFPNLKFISTRSTGFDHIDKKAADKHGVKVSHVPGYGAHAVAEFAIGLMLSLSRNIYKGIDRIKETGDFDFEGLCGTDLYGKTLGVVGTGRIGKTVVEIANGFGMNVVACDPYPDMDFAKKNGFEYVSLEELLAQADFITLHVPYNESTHHLLNKKNMSKIKKGAYLVNTARGGLIETEALVKALNDGVLKGAGLDVLEDEREMKAATDFIRSGHPEKEKLRNVLLDHVLIGMPSVLITPHSAFNSEEAIEEILETTIKNIEAFISGKPINLIPLE